MLLIKLLQVHAFVRWVNWKNILSSIHDPDSKAYANNSQSKYLEFFL